MAKNVSDWSTFSFIILNVNVTYKWICVSANDRDFVVCPSLLFCSVAAVTTIAAAVSCTDVHLVFVVQR